MPASRPWRSISALPPQLGCGGAVKMALVEHVFPVAGELALRGDAGVQRVPPAALAGNDDEVAHLQRGRGAELERGHAEAAERLHEAEPGFEVVAQRMAREHAAVARREPDRVRLGDQVADGDDEAARADEDAVPGPLRPQDAGGERVLRDGRAQAHDGAERGVEVEGHLLLLRLRRQRDLPIELVAHDAAPGVLRKTIPPLPQRGKGSDYFVAHGSWPAANASARAPHARRAAVAACRASVGDGRALCPSPAGSHSGASSPKSMSKGRPFTVTAPSRRRSIS